MKKNNLTINNKFLKLFLSFRGRINRSSFWLASFALWGAFIILFLLVEALFGRPMTLFLYPLFFWSLFSILAKRYHDIGKTPLWLLLLLIPLVGVGWVAIELGFRSGMTVENRYGQPPNIKTLEYLTVK